MSKIVKKEVDIIMQNEEMLEILNRIQICLERDSLYEAKQYIKIEIDNLKGIVQKD